jgi:nitrite reductase/ring-hydroxylating ferredoxin subunit
LAVGLTGAVAAAVTGLTDWQATDGNARRVGLAHAIANTTGAVLFTASLVLRKQQHRVAGRLFSLLGYAVALGAAYLGGNLVYSKRIGVNHAPEEELPGDFVRVLAADELREGELQRVEANGVRVVLLRRGAMIFAIAEICSHLGGPLAEGELQGNTVRCPWHGSRFSMEDGRVIDGPATHPQPCLEARVRDGQIEVRLKPTVRE